MAEGNRLLGVEGPPGQLQRNRRPCLGAAASRGVAPLHLRQPGPARAARGNATRDGGGGVRPAQAPYVQAPSQAVRPNSTGTRTNWSPRWGRMGAARLYIYADDLALTPILFLDYDSLRRGFGIVPALDFVFGDQLGTPRLVEDEDRAEVPGAEIEPYGRRTSPLSRQDRVEPPLPGSLLRPRAGPALQPLPHVRPSAGALPGERPLGHPGGEQSLRLPPQPAAHGRRARVGSGEPEKRQAVR